MNPVETTDPNRNPVLETLPLCPLPRFKTVPPRQVCY